MIDVFYTFPNKKLTLCHMTKCQFIAFAVRCRQLLGEFCNILRIMPLDVVNPL